jgi:hypothetical protein
VPKTVPTPVAAAIGIVPTVLDGIKSLPGKAVQIPVLAVSSVLTSLETARREYEELVTRGEDLVTRLRGGAVADVQETLETVLEATPLVSAQDQLEDAVQDAVAKVTELLDRAADRKPKPVPHDTAATPEVVEIVEAVSHAVSVPEVEKHNDLPLEDYDHMTLGSLRGRIRSLSVPELVQVRDYEKAHAHRLPVVTLLDNRIAKLATDAEATPSPDAGAAVVTPAVKAVKPVKRAAPKKSSTSAKAPTA